MKKFIWMKMMKMKNKILINIILENYNIKKFDLFVLNKEKYKNLRY